MFERVNMEFDLETLIGSTLVAGMVYGIISIGVSGDLNFVEFGGFLLGYAISMAVFRKMVSIDKELL